MAVSQNRDGTWRAQIYIAPTGPGEKAQKPDVCTLLPSEPYSFHTKGEAYAAIERAKTELKDRKLGGMKVGELFVLFQTHGGEDVKATTLVTYVTQAKPFAERYANERLSAIDLSVVKAYVHQHGGRKSHLSGLSAMWGYAVRAGLIDRNPFHNTGLFKRSAKARKVTPATLPEVERILTIAREHTSPDYYGWLTMACKAGPRPGEIDAMRREHLDLDKGVYWIQPDDGNLNSLGYFDSPKNGRGRPIGLVDEILEVLAMLPVRSPYLFTTEAGTHFTPSARSAFWKVARTGLDRHRSLYASTRHHYGWYAVNKLLMPIHVVADQLGHTDGGALVGKLYGHPEPLTSIERLRNAGNAALTENTNNAVEGNNA